MPVLEVQLSKKKTLLPNILQVAKALHSSSHSALALPRPQEIVEYFKVELGTGGSCPSLKKLEKGDPASGAYLAGKHDKGTLRALLAGYVETFVLCGVCQKPETSYKFHKTKKTIKLDCVGCGALLKIESEHKLCKYIRKQHEAESTDKKRGKKNRKEKKSRKSLDCERSQTSPSSVPRTVEAESPSDVAIISEGGMVASTDCVGFGTPVRDDGDCENSEASGKESDTESGKESDTETAIEIEGDLDDAQGDEASMGGGGAGGREHWSPCVGVAYVM
ncbi:Eukaryotic translation initiation factor 5 [Seminavis robusta]|uniref:Eukaryotic translation initiation factor 5 n=1 Tax=Seminavis robusta TaxID=568900 RepID=A0A9N8E188_9STRA|nr:Eukaryotic translation initiation factor 5 [Seminavis robusta]|eukprot:Sro545_g163930.1 Eukaryotic translation initiation factor 5 (277) ;mRNA; r:54044-54874